MSVNTAHKQINNSSAIKCKPPFVGEFWRAVQN